jgi:predicted metal-dependent hydrolase
MGGDPIATALYNALSATFPKGEAFFVESVRKFRDGTDPKLAAEIRAFVTQEVMHSREHIAFNKRAHEAGYDLKPLEDRVDWRLDFVRSKPPIASLAATMALEHFTAILATSCCAIPGTSPVPIPRARRCGAGTRSRRSSTRGVAYDTWLHATKEMAALQALEVKAKVMLLVTRNFLVDRTIGALELLRQDGLTGPQGLGAAVLVRVRAARDDAQGVRGLGELLHAALPPLEPRRPRADRRCGAAAGVRAAEGSGVRR